MVSAPSLTLSSHAHLPPLYTLVVPSVPLSQPINVMLALGTPLLVAIKMRGCYLTVRTGLARWRVPSYLVFSRPFFTFFSFLSLFFSAPFLFFLFRFLSFIFLFLPHSILSFCLLISIHSRTYPSHATVFLAGLCHLGLSPFRYLRCASLHFASL